MRRYLLLASLWLAPTAVWAVSPAVQQALAEGRYGEALEHIEQRLQQQPRDAQARFLQGLALTMLERLDQASQVFAELARDYPQYPEPANNLAVLQARRGQLELAERTLRRLLGQHPDYASAHENLGDVLTAQAEAAYRRAAELDSADTTLHSKLRLLGELNALPQERREADRGPAQPAPAVVRPSPPQPTTLRRAAPAAATTAPVATSTPAPASRAPAESAPTGTATAPTAADVRLPADVAAALEAWREAWERGDVDAYLDAYAQEFVPPRELDRVSWAAQRRDRVRPERNAQIRFAPLRVERLGAERWRIDARQDYRARNYADSVIKRLILVREGETWRIGREVTLQ